MATVDRVVRPRHVARERARGRADLPRRRGARAALRRRDDRLRRVRGLALSGRRRHSCATAPSRDLCRDCQWPAERVYAQLGLTVHRYSDWLTAEDREQARTLASSTPVRPDPGLHARRRRHRRARLRRRAALLRDRIARRRAARRAGAAPVSRVGAPDGVRHARACCARSTSPRRSSRTASTCPGASSARWRGRKASASRRGTWRTGSAASSSATTTRITTR